MVDLINKKVKHRIWGVGTVIDQDESYITIEFLSKISKFQYPQAFEGFLIPEDSAVLNAIKNEIEEAKAAAEAAKAEKATKRAIEEATKLAAIQAKAAASGIKLESKKAYTPTARVDGQALTFLVFQGDTYDEEYKGQFLWAPKYTKSGTTCHHWERLRNVREGDVIFHCSNGYIMAISRAKAACEDSARPDQTTGDWTQWEKDGRRINCEYHQLKTPLKYGKYKDKILEYCSMKYAPFDKFGNGNMGYLFELNSNLAAFFIKEIALLNAEVIELDYLRFLLVK